MNVEEPQLRSRVRGPNRVRGSAAWNVGELEHDVAPEKCGVACALSKPTEQKKSHWTVPAPALLSPPNATERQSPPTELTVAGGPWRRSQCKPNFRRLVPTMMASIAGGTRVGRVCSVAFGLIARCELSIGCPVGPDLGRQRAWDPAETTRWRREPDSNHRSRSGGRSLGCCRREMPDR